VLSIAIGDLIKFPKFKATIDHDIALMIRRFTAVVIDVTGRQAAQTVSTATTAIRSEAAEGVAGVTALPLLTLHLCTGIPLYTAVALKIADGALSRALLDGAASPGADHTAVLFTALPLSTVGCLSAAT